MGRKKAGGSSSRGCRAQQTAPSPLAALAGDKVERASSPPPISGCSPLLLNFSDDGGSSSAPTPCSNEPSPLIHELSVGEGNAKISNFYSAGKRKDDNILSHEEEGRTRELTAPAPARLAGAMASSKHSAGFAKTRRSASIWEAVLEGDVEEVAHQLQRGADIDEARDEGRTPLMIACAAGNEEMVKYLLEHSKQSPHVEARAIAGWTPLMVAAGAGFLPVVKALVSAGASLAARDSEFQASPLMWACGGGHSEVVKYFLHETTCSPEEINARNSQQWTPLMVAADGGQLEVVKLLVEAGASLNLCNAEGRTALDLARAARNKVVESCLRRAGARGGEDFWVAVEAADLDAVVSAVTADPHLITARDGNGRTALLLACQTGDLGLVQLLVEAGSKVEFRDPSGMTPLHVAVMVGGLAMVRYLISHSGPRALDATTAAGWTPLMQAVQCGGDIEMVRFLVDSGASVNACGRDGRTVLDVARSAGKGALSDYFVAKGGFSGNEVKAQIEQVTQGRRGGGFPLW